MRPPWQEDAGAEPEAERDPLAEWFRGHFALLDARGLLGAPVAGASPEAGALPVPAAPPATGFVTAAAAGSGTLPDVGAGEAAGGAAAVGPDPKPGHRAKPRRDYDLNRCREAPPRRRELHLNAGRGGRVASAGGVSAASQRAHGAQGQPDGGRLQGGRPSGGAELARPGQAPAAAGAPAPAPCGAWTAAPGQHGNGRADGGRERRNAPAAARRAPGGGLPGAQLSAGDGAAGAAGRAVPDPGAPAPACSARPRCSLPDWTESDDDAGGGGGGGGGGGRASGGNCLGGGGGGGGDRGGVGGAAVKSGAGDGRAGEAHQRQRVSSREIHVRSRPSPVSCCLYRAFGKSLQVQLLFWQFLAHTPTGHWRSPHKRVGW